MLATAPARAERIVAITIDDLPFLGEPGPGDTVEAATGRLIDALVRRKVPATAFVTCDRTPEQLGVLRQWRAAGLELANHAGSHKRLDDLSEAAWEADVTTCGSTIAAHATQPRYFRFPFLQSGDSPRRRDAAAARLSALGYVTAPVSIDTADWLIAEAYPAAL